MPIIFRRMNLENCCFLIDGILQGLRQICDQHVIVLIADEIQSGFGRTGAYFGIEQSAVEPDLMTIAKGVAAGFPIAAVVGKSHIMDAPLPGGLGGTYAGSPVACTAALAVLEVIEQEQLIERANHIGRKFQACLEKLQQAHPSILAEVRIRGAMIAIELFREGDINQPNTSLTQSIIAHAADYGLILLAFGFYGNVIRFLPPLTIEDNILEEGLDNFFKLFSALVMQHH